MVRRASKEGEVRRSAVLVGDLGHAKFLNEILFETRDSERGPSRARLGGTIRRAICEIYFYTK